MEKLEQKQIHGRYLIAVFSILVAGIIAEVFIQYSLSTQKDRSRVINVAGRQRMLSQKIGKLAAMARYEKDQIKKEIHLKELKKSYEEWRTSHQELMSGSEKRKIEAASEYGQDIANEYENLTPMINNVGESVDCLVNQCLTIEAQFVALEKAVDDYLPFMHQIVNLTDQKIQADIRAFSSAEIFIYLGTTSVLIFFFIFVIFPSKKIMLAQIEEMKKKENLIKRMEGVANIGGWELDLKTNETLWTDQVYHIHCLPVGESTDKANGISFYASHERERIEKCITECATLKKRFDEEFEFIDKEGNHKWVRSAGEPVLDQEGQAVKLFGIFQDVTEKKKAEVETEESKRYMELAIEGSGLGIWDWYLEDNSVKFDRRWAEMLGIDFTKIKMELSTWESRVHPDDLGQCYKDIKDYLEGNSPVYENIHRMKHANGGWVYILDRGRISEWNEEGKPIRFTGTHLDITEATEKNKQQQFILESMELGIWKWNLEKHRVEWDDAMFKLFELEGKAGEVDANLFFDNVHPDDKEDVADAVNRALSGESEFFCHFRIVTGTEKTRYIAGRGKVEFNAEGKAINMYGINYDRTEESRVRHELEGQRQLAAHNAKLASIGKLAAGVGHEINNPLAIVRGYLQTMEKKAKKGELKEERMFDLIDKMKSASDRISIIVQGLRSFSRQDHNLKKNFDPVDMVENSYQLIKEIYEKDGVFVSYQSDLGLGVKEVYGNRGKIQQVLMNLISNAKDATEDQNDRKIELIVSELTTNIQIVVKDNGHGIPKEIQKKIFEPFFTTKDINKGTGIGLALSHQILQDHQGEIELNSSEGNGTSFIIRLPFSHEVELMIEDESFSSENKKFDLNVLIVEDEPELQHLISEQMKQFGASVEVCSNGAEAYQYILENKNDLDLVMTDMRMPVVDGENLIKQIEEVSKDCGIKILVMTGGVETDFESEETYLSEMIHGQIFKPFSDEMLLKALNAIDFDDDIKDAA